jgi:hypothetical protein
LITQLLPSSARKSQKLYPKFIVANTIQTGPTVSHSSQLSSIKELQIALHKEPKNLSIKVVLIATLFTSIFPLTFC